MYELLNALLLQRRTIHATAIAAGAVPSAAQLAPLVAATKSWIKVVQARIREDKKMRFHHQFVKSKELDVRQIQTIHANTTAIYVLVNTLRDHFSMSTLFTLLGESFVTRSTRREHPSSQQDENDESSSEKEDENDEDDERDEEDESDENQTTRQREVEEHLEENRDVFETQLSEESTDSSPLNDQHGVDVETKESENNAEKGRAPQSSSSSNSNSSSSEKKEIAQSTTSQRFVVLESSSDSESFSDLRRSSRRSPQTSSGKGKRSISSGEDHAGSSSKRRRRSGF
jgi:hypothetical protein